MTKTRRLMASLPNVLRPAGRTKGKSFSVPGDEKSIIVRSVRQRFWVLAKLMRSGEFEKLYTQWFESPIPPRGINIQLPMSDALKRDIREPNDKPNS